MSIMENTRRASVPTRWAVDPEKSSVEFAVKTFWGLSTVRGRFERFDGGYDADPDRQSIELTIDAGSLNTELGKRDEHLRSADFFHIADHPAGAVQRRHVFATPATGRCTSRAALKRRASSFRSSSTRPCDRSARSWR